MGLFLGERKETEFLLKCARFEALIGALDEIGRHILVIEMLLA